jgi:hypothetical protein
VSISSLIPHDKALHALGGALLFAGARAFSLALGIDPSWAGVTALAAVTAVAAVKECFDALHPATHTVDLRDFLFTVAGGSISAASSIG